MKHFWIFVFIVRDIALGFTQNMDTIVLQNASFEDTPTCCQTPSGWVDCGFKFETPPDIQPALNLDDKPAFGVVQKPFHGKTYLGMVVRENETYERVSQRLIQPLQNGKCYSFSIMLCRSDTYLSPVNSDPTKLKQFTEPIILRIWGGRAFCDHKQLLAKSSLIENTEWEWYDFDFKVESDLQFFELEAYYDLKADAAYNGNVLLDNATNIIEVDCDSLPKTKNN